MRNLFLYSLIILVFSATGQNNAGQIIQSAFQKVNQGKSEEAIEEINELLKTDPDNPRALGVLGLAYRNLQNHKKSIEAFEKALKTESPSSNQVRYNLGLSYALDGNNDKAFEALMKVKETNAFNITNIGLSPATSQLSSDPRYKKLFPSPKEYADPFTEGGKLIHDWGGENVNDNFGWIARAVGDVNDDGVLDITTCAPSNDEGGNNAGKIYVYSGKTGDLLWEYAGKDANGQLGISVEAGGDVNGDGIPDVVAGAAYANKTLVFSGKDGKIIHEWVGEDEKGAFGRGVKIVGDVNGDGYSDVLIGEPFQIWGAPLNSQQIESAGNTYLYSGKDGKILQKWTGNSVGDGFGTAVAGKTTDGTTLLMVGAPSAGENNGGQVKIFKGMNESPFFTMNADATGGRLGGMFMSVVGDVDGDGVQDVYASDWANSAEGPSTGRIYVHSGANGRQLHNLTGETQGDGFGIGIADAGDVNKDGHDDLVIGAWQHASAAPSGGKVYVYSGKDGSLMRTLTGKVVGETLGFDTTGIGDVDGDGVVDLLLTSAYSAINGTRSGRMFVVSGK